MGGTRYFCIQRIMLFRCYLRQGPLCREKAKKMEYRENMSLLYGYLYILGVYVEEVTP